MEIILTQDVANLGLTGQVMKVSEGYARNYLLPGKRALKATPNNLRALAKQREEFEKRTRETKDLALDLKKKLSSLTLTIFRKSADRGKLYGAVTPQDIADAAQAEGFALDKRRLKIAEPVKLLGDYEIGIRLHPEVTASFKLKVVKEPEPEPPAPAPETKTDGKARKSRRSGEPRGQAPKPAKEASAKEASAREAPAKEAPATETPAPQAAETPAAAAPATESAPETAPAESAPETIPETTAETTPESAADGAPPTTATEGN
ncbi:MAG: 50S ribosomal protein L9 [Deltaproteobacteria bacterium]|jgi:large subunit ribosomal protein L9|nr:50S ribosomal protein L9 [Deltaproteobacteria bacterium]